MAGSVAQFKEFDRARALFQINAKRESFEDYGALSWPSFDLTGSSPSMAANAVRF